MSGLRFPTVNRLHFAALYLGLASAVGQVIIIREALVAFSGNELTLSLIMACWFMGVFAGSAAGSRIAAKYPVPASAAGAFAMGASVVGVFAAARTARSWLSIGAGSVAGFSSIATGCAALTLPVSFAVGFCFPALAAAYRAAVEKQSGSAAADNPSGIGLVYTIEAIGATVGGFGYTFLLAGIVSHGVITAVLGLGGAWASMMILTSPGKCPVSGGDRLAPGEKSTEGRRPVFGSLAAVAFLAAAVALGVVVGGPFESCTEDLRWKAIGAGLPLVKTIETRYQNVVLTSQSGLNSIYCDGTYSFSFPEPYQASESAALPLTLHPDPGKVLLVGDGCQELVPHVYEFLLQAKGPGKFAITVVPFDPQVHDLYMEFASPEIKFCLTRPEVSVNSGDGRLFIKGCPDRFDLAILNLPEPSSIMTNRYFTTEFYSEVKSVLNPGGIVVTAVSSTVNYMGGDVAEYCGSVVRTLGTVFREVRVIPGTVARVFATDSSGRLALSPDVLEKRYQDRGFSSSHFDPAMFHSMVEEDKVKWFMEALGDVGSFEVNTDGRPVAYLKHLRIWERMTTGAGSTRGHGFVSILGVFWPWLLGFTGLFILTAGFRTETSTQSGTVISRAGSFGPIAVTMTAGFSSMATQIGIIAMYQSIFGYLYAAIGAINAVFMAGLVAGGARSAFNGARWIVRADLFVLGVPILAMALPFAGSGIAAQAAFVAVIALSGFATGLVLPAAGHYMEGGRAGRAVPSLDAAQSADAASPAGADAGADADAVADSVAAVMTEASVASRLECADHAGAMAGALLMGLALIPAAGMAGSLLIVAAFKASTLPWTLKIARLSGS